MTNGLTRLSQPDRSTLFLWGFLAVLAVVEAMILGARLDAAPLRDRVPHWWASVLGHSGFILPLAIAVATGTLLLLLKSGQPLSESFLDSGILPPQRWWRWTLAGHLITYVIFYQLAVFVFDGDLAASATPGRWVVALALTGLITFGLWGATMTAGEGLRLARSLTPVLPVGVAVGIAAWGAGQMTEEWWGPLRHWTFWVVRHSLAVVVSEVVARPADFVIGTERFLIEIAPRCSGYEGIGVMGVFLAVHLWVARRDLRFPRAFLLFPIGMGVVWFANSLRLVALIAVGTWVSPEVATGGFHSYSGWVLCCGLALGLAAWANHSWFLTVPGAAAAASAGGSVTAAAHLVPLLTIVAITMLTRALSADGFDLLYPLGVLATLLVLWWFRREYAGFRRTCSWGAVAAGALGFMVWTVGASAPVDYGFDSPLRQGLADLPRGLGVAWLVWRVLGAVVTIPVAEELAFRGYLTRRLIAADFESVPLGQFTLLPCLASSLLFGAMHERFFAATVCGLIYAVALSRRGELSDAIGAHAVTNALIAAYALATGDWWLLG